MYVTGREIIPTTGRLQDALSFVTTITGSMNEKFNSNLAVSVELGGNPNKIWITGFWATMGDYQTFVEGYMADPKIQVAFNTADSVVSEAQDQIGQILRAPGERKQFAQMNKLCDFYNSTAGCSNEQLWNFSSSTTIFSN